MKIAILSDTHGNQETTDRALREVRIRGIDTVLHCGDIDDPLTIDRFKGFQTHFVFGNCDWERAAMREAMEGIGATLHEGFGQIELKGVSIGFVHGDDGDLFLDLQNSQAFEFLFYGHTHVAAEKLVGKTRVINPGALHRARPRGFAILDLSTRQVETVELD